MTHCHDSWLNARHTIGLQGTQSTISTPGIPKEVVSSSEAKLPAPRNGEALCQHRWPAQSKEEGRVSSALARASAREASSRCCRALCEAVTAFAKKSLHFYKGSGL